MNEGLITFDGATADALIAMAQNAKKRQIGNITESQNGEEHPLFVVIGSAISPGKYNGKCYIIDISPATGSLTFNNVRNSSDTGADCEVWHLAEAGSSTNWLPADVICFVAMRSGITSDGKNIFIVNMCLPAITNKTKTYVLEFSKDTGKVSWAEGGGACT